MKKMEFKLELSKERERIRKVKEEEKKIQKLIY